jgi:hypothetical protein
MSADRLSVASSVNAILRNAPRFSWERQDGRSFLTGGIMKLKQRDWTDVEHRLKAVDSPLLQKDRIMRAALLTIAIFGVAALAGVVGYLAWPYCIPGL